MVPLKIRGQKLSVFWRGDHNFTVVAATDSVAWLPQQQNASLNVCDVALISQPWRGGIHFFRFVKLILSAYASSMLPILLLPLSMACDNLTTSASWRGNLTRFAAMAVVPSFLCAAKMLQVVGCLEPDDFALFVVVLVAILLFQCDAMFMSA
ncbi:hypothetical protein Tco_1423537 [Tanacetum coccineum]